MREKHSDFEWPESVQLHYQYGRKVVIENTSSEDLLLTEELKVKLANIAVKFSQVELHGFRAE